MTGAERVLAVLRREEPDCVPTFEWDIDSGVVAAMAGGGSYEDFVEQFDHDAVMASPDYARTPLTDGLFRDEWGVTRRAGLEDYAMPVDAQAPVRTRRDAERWRPPDPDKPGRLDTLAQRVARFGGQKAVFIRLRDVWSGPRDLLGYEELLVRTLEDPECVEILVAKCVNHSLSIARRAVKLGAQVAMTGDDLADTRGPLVDPMVWESLFLPHFRRLCSGLHACGLKLWKHTDGNILPLMDSLVEAGIDGIDPVDPMAGMDLGTFKKRWGGRVAIKGNVDCAGLLVRGTEAEVRGAVRECIRTAGPGGGYACSSSNSIHSGVKPGLYRAMLEAVRELGRYPLAL